MELGNCNSVSFRSILSRVMGSFFLFLLCFTGVAIEGQSATIHLPHFKAERTHDYVELLNQNLIDSSVQRSDEYFLLAQLNSQVGKKEIAIQLGLQAHHMRPDDTEIFLFLIKLLVREDRLKEAQLLFKKLSDQQKENSDVLIQQGMLQERLGDFHAALVTYRKAAELDAENDLLQMLLGKLLLKQGETGAALIHLEKACRIGKRNANAHYALSRAQLLMGESDAANRTLKKFQRLKAIEVAKANQENQSRDNLNELQLLVASFHTEMGVAYIRMNMHYLAELHLKQATEVSSKYSKGFDNLANFYMQKNQINEAKPLLERLVELEPNNADHHLNLGTVAVRMRDLVQAKFSFEKALHIAPNDPNALSNLSRFYLQLGIEFPKVLKMCLNLIEQEASASHYDLLAWAYYANGYLKEAVEASSKSVELAPNHPGYRQRNQKLLQLKAPK